VEVIGATAASSPLTVPPEAELAGTLQKHAETCDSTHVLAAERRHHILDALARDGKVVAADLGTSLDVSHDTIRRDLQELAAAGLLRRVHGGALPPNLTPLAYAERERRAPAAKRGLARAAAQLLRDDVVVVVGGGTSAVELAREVPHELRATVFTTSVPVALELASRRHVDLHLIGGRVEKAALETAGPGTVDALRGVQADICFFGAWAIHPDVGVSVGHVDDVPALRAMFGGAAEVVAIATADKLGTSAPYVVAPVEELTHVVTERTAAEALVSPYERAGVTVLRA
jgi:DeoR/GlpR family transcriptional regulator of sugar metabolism